MTTLTASSNDFAFDYTTGAAAQIEQAKVQTAGIFKRAMNAWIARNERLVIARLSAIDPRLAGDLQAARDRAEWAK